MGVWLIYSLSFLIFGIGIFIISMAVQLFMGK